MTNIDFKKKHGYNPSKVSVNNRELWEISRKYTDIYPNNK